MNMISHANNFLYVKCSKIELQKMEEDQNVIVYFTYFIYLSGYQMAYYTMYFMFTFYEHKTDVSLLFCISWGFLVFRYTYV